MADAALIFDLCVALSSGRTLHAADGKTGGVVTAGAGKVIDWREVKSGHTVVEGADAYDMAVILVETVGWKAAEIALDA